MQDNQVTEIMNGNPLTIGSF